MGCGVGSKEKRGHDLRHYCNSSHYSTFFNFRGLQPIVEEHVWSTPLRRRLIQGLTQDFAGVPFNHLNNRHAKRLDVDEIVELEPEEASRINAVLHQLIDYLGEQGCLADLSWTAQDDRRGEPSREPTIDRLECPAAKRGKLGDRLAAPPGVAIPDDGLQARRQKLEQRELFHECGLFTNNNKG
jgi:hypothetical protein